MQVRMSARAPVGTDSTHPRRGHAGQAGAESSIDVDVGIDVVAGVGIGVAITIGIRAW